MTKETLCTSCDINTFINCRWIYGEVPVKGWRAKKGIMPGAYNITACPNYIRDVRGKRRAQLKQANNKEYYGDLQ